MPGPDFGYTAPVTIPITGEHIHRLGNSVFLWLFLRSMQTAKSGVVNWEKPVSIEWIADRIPAPPRKSTLRLWLAALRLNGYITAVKTPLGFKITVVDPKDWPSLKQLRSKKLISIAELRLTAEELKER